MKKCSFCSGIIEENVSICPFCGTEYIVQDDIQTNSMVNAVDLNDGYNDTVLISSENFDNSKNKNIGFQTQDFQQLNQQINQQPKSINNQFVSNNKGMQPVGATSLYAQPADFRSNNSYQSAQVPQSDWDTFYKAHADTPTKVAVIICAVFAFITVAIELFQLLFNGYYSVFSMNPMSIIIVVFEFLGYISMGVILLVKKQWWSALVILIVAATTMIYSLIVAHTLSSYLMLGLSIWAMVMLLKINKKFKSGMN